MNELFKDPEVSKALKDLRAAIGKALPAGAEVKTSMVYVEVKPKGELLQVGIDVDCCPCPHCAARTVNQITDLFEQIVIEGMGSGAVGVTQH